MIPTFLGSTILVFTILQLAPGGPIEQIISNLESTTSFTDNVGGGTSELIENVNSLSTCNFVSMKD